MALDEASSAFADLSAGYARQGRHRIMLFGLVGVVLSSAALLLVLDATRTSAAYRYAAMARGKLASEPACDNALDRRRLWFGNSVISNDSCLPKSFWPDRRRMGKFPGGTFSFLAVGDWGRDGMCCQVDVARAMAYVSKQTNPAFVVSTGDNFYPRGVRGPDDEKIDRAWRQVFIYPYETLRKPWKLVLGNHDYLENAVAQTVLSEREELWNMPEPYFFETVFKGQVFIAYIDTTCMYYPQDQMHIFKGSGVTPGHRDGQLATLRSKLNESTARWKIVVGHHPLYSSGENAVGEAVNLKQMRTTLAPIFKETGVIAYFCGHDHLLEHFEGDGVHHFVSGAGSKLTDIRVRNSNNVFSLDKHGFVQVVFEGQDASEMVVRFVDISGAVVHTARVARPT